MPPVKLACLACRASRIRCDGAQPCYNCLSRKQDCRYQPSKRGGSRKGSSSRAVLNQDVNAIETQKTKQRKQITQLLSPGAGLRCRREQLSSGLSNFHPTSALAVRVYENNQALLNAYYIYIHPFFPVLPSSIVPVAADHPTSWFIGEKAETPLLDQFSPLGLALSAILVLIKLPNEDSSDWIAFNSLRMQIAHDISQRALRQVEADTDLDEYHLSGNSSSAASQATVAHTALHPSVPIELENIIALLILSNYEHIQRGNLAKMAARISHALILAKELALHRQPPIDDEFSEARRRTWWMTFAYGQLCSLVCHDVFAGVGDVDKFTTPFPQLGSDDEAWSIYIEVLQLSVVTVRFVNNQSLFTDTGADMSSFLQRMVDLNAEIDRISYKLDLLNTKSSLGAETMPAQILRRLSYIKLASSRIRVHRQNAFANIPLFSKDSCDIANRCHFNADQAIINQDGSTNVESDVFSPPPFDCAQSAAICTDSALAISRQLQQLCKLRRYGSQACLPCTMPVSTCCAMQASYALLMQLWSTRVLAQGHVDGSVPITASSERLEEEIRHGLEGIISSLGTQAEIYGAIGGMKIEIEAALQLVP